ncbi:MAG: Hpt domain-containing protein [Acidobacteriota bacterium]
MTSDPLLDLSTLQMLSDLGDRRGKDLLGQLYGLFIAQGPESFAKMRQAVASGEPNTVREVAHSLKGSYRSIGTPVLADLCFELEQRGKAGDLGDDADTVLDRLEETFEATSAALGDYLGRRTTP